MNFIDMTVRADADGLHAATDGLDIRVPDEHVGTLEPYRDRRVALGIRPEHIQLGDRDGAAPCAFDAGIDVIEQLGAQMLLDVMAGGQSIIVAGIDPTFADKVGERLRFSIPPDRMRFFDPQTERAVS